MPTISAANRTPTVFDDLFLCRSSVRENREEVVPQLTAVQVWRRDKIKAACRGVKYQIHKHPLIGLIDFSASITK